MKKEKKPVILLVPFHQHLSALYDSFIHKGYTVFGLVYESHLHIRQLGRVLPEPIKIFVGYPQIFFRWFTFGVQVPKYIRSLSKKVARLKPDTLLVFDIYHWYFLQALFIKYNNPQIKLVVYSETKRFPKRKISTLILRFFLKQTHKRQDLIDAFFVYTEEGRQFFEPYLDQKKIYVIPAPVNTEIFNSEGLVPKVKLPGLPLRILCNARFDTYKNHEHLLKAVKILLEKGKLCDLTLIGRSESGRDRIEALVIRYGLTEQVTFLDPKPMAEMPTLYHEHDVLVLPSYNEAIGMVVPEAMACGLPTITSDTVGANVYVKAGETGWIFPTGDVEGLVNALLECFDATELAKRGQAAQAHIANNFTVPIIAERFLQLLDVQS